MVDSSTDPLNRWLADYAAGDKQALDRIIPLLQDELHALAKRSMSREPGDHTLETTALVNEAYLRLVDQKNARYQNRAHFLAIAAQLMRRILIDHARRRKAKKRGGTEGKLRIADEDFVDEQGLGVDLLDLNEAMKRLAALDPRQCSIVEFRFFGGLTFEEIAAVSGLSLSTVKREWNLARAWLYRELGGD
jgi:RNA polymerase sigma-70 factor (ECF subfamily)